MNMSNVFRCEIRRNIETQGFLSEVDTQTDTGYSHSKSHKHQVSLKEPQSAFTPAGQPRNCAVVVFT